MFMFMKVSIHADGGWYVVVLHPDNDQLLHGQPGGLSHGGADGVTYRYIHTYESEMLLQFESLPKLLSKK